MKGSDRRKAAKVPTPSKKFAKSIKRESTGLMKATKTVEVLEL
jgi:hypothetical protein